MFFRHEEFANDLQKNKWADELQAETDGELAKVASELLDSVKDPKLVNTDVSSAFLVDYFHWLLFTVRRHYNAVNFLPNSHKIHPIAHPLGRGMVCILWVQTLIYTLSQSLQWYVTFGGSSTAGILQSTPPVWELQDRKWHLNSSVHKQKCLTVTLTMPALASWQPKNDVTMKCVNLWRDYQGGLIIYYDVHAWQFQKAQVIFSSADLRWAQLGSGMKAWEAKFVRRCTTMNLSMVGGISNQSFPALSTHKCVYKQKKWGTAGAHKRLGKGCLMHEDQCIQDMWQPLWAKHPD